MNKINKIIKFFHKHRIIDSHIGIWKIHLWIYVFATYYSLLNIFGVTISIYKRTILDLSVRLNPNKKPRLFSFKFTIFGMGIDTDKRYYEKVHKKVDEYFKKKDRALKEFKDNLSEAQRKLIQEYEYLRWG